MSVPETIYFCFIDYTTVWIATNYGKFLKRWEITDHFTCLLRNRYAGHTTLMAETEEELKSFLMKVKEESEKVG